MFPNHVCQRKPPPLRDAVVPGALIQLKFGDGDGPNLCRVKKVDVSSTFIVFNPFKELYT